MFNNLLESKPKKQRSKGLVAFSMVLHVVLIGGAVVATAHARQALEKPKQEKIDFVEVKKNEPEPPKNEPPPQVAAPPPPKGFQVLSAPVEIPDVLPDIDLSKKVTDEADFTGKGQQGGVSKGVERPVVQDQPYFEFQVEKPVVQAPGSSQPRYPDILRQAGVEGEVLAQFVVDTTGRAEANSFKVLKSSHDLFAQSVRSSLSGMRFIPAEVGGRKVKQLVQQPFAFAITK
ncbi:MAG: energy transducer TonB [Gemmatimonadaceae bacterium]